MVTFNEWANKQWSAKHVYEMLFGAISIYGMLLYQRAYNFLYEGSKQVMSLRQTFKLSKMNFYIRRSLFSPYVQF